MTFGFLFKVLNCVIIVSIFLLRLALHLYGWEILDILELFLISWKLCGVLQEVAVVIVAVDELFAWAF